MRFKCPKCGKALSVKDEMAGKKAKCPACSHLLTIPAAIREPLPPSPPTAPSDDSHYQEEPGADRGSAPVPAQKPQRGPSRRWFSGDYLVLPMVVPVLGAVALVLLSVLFFALLTGRKLAARPYDNQRHSSSVPHPSGRE